MIEEVDEALRGLVRREALNGSDVEVVFDAPTRDWAARRNAPTVDVYLYDIREDLRRRERGMLNEYDGDGHVTGRHLPPRHFVLSYLVTAWTQRPEDEHRLLSVLLSCFLRHEKLPDDLLQGSIAEIGLPVAITVALPPSQDRSLADVWSALGGELKPSLDVQVTAPISSGARIEAGPLVREQPRFGLTRMDAGGGKTAKGAKGTKGGKGAAGPPAGVGEETVVEETVAAGPPSKPGRILRIRER
jgi:uncharacterized protein DUF4255